MSRGRRILGAVMFMCVAIGIGWWQSSRTPVFPELQGPLHITTVADPTPTLISDYPGSGKHSVAIWVNDPDSSWLGLAMGFKSIGLPFRLVSDVDQALEHKVIMVYPSLTGGNTTPDELSRLRDHVGAGGTLVGFSVIGGGMSSLFGFQQSAEHAVRSQLEFQDSPLTAGMIESKVERTIRLGDTTEADSGLPGTHYTGAEQVVAQFEDGSAAVTYKAMPRNGTNEGVGHAYAFGLDIGHFMLRAFNGRFANMADTYVNAYQPQVDIFLRVLLRIYQQGEPDAVTLSPTPHGKAFTALLTHDVDFTRSINNIADYVALETRFGVPATYFIQTKYMTDYNDRQFFNPSRAETLKLLIDRGMEIASHTVAHSNEFSRMPVGSGDEQYPAYQPFVRDFATVENASMMGELRVSKFLLDSLSGTQIVSFRPGHLSLPEPLPQLLVANGYRFSSSMTANEAMTHLPFRLSHDRSYGRQVNAYEFPVTIEDEQGSLTARFDEIVALSNQIGQYQGLVMLMIHTDMLGEKLEFVERYLTHFYDTAWFDTVSGYGNWWAARESVVTDVVDASADSLRLRINAAQALDGLTLRVPDGWQYNAGLEGTRQIGELVILGRVDGRAELLFTR
ncbi:MAG: polysaccharide deacetylase family protein [Pseudohongiella sp.]|nr:polysaccharide deacetylase family protein [Pseudohongiella sp.]